MLVMLISYNEYKVVSGEFVKPSEPESTVPATTLTEAQKQQHHDKLNHFNKTDGLAQRLIVTTVSEKVLVHIVNLDYSKHMWEK